MVVTIPSARSTALMALPTLTTPRPLVVRLVISLGARLPFASVGKPHRTIGSAAVPVIVEKQCPV